MRSESELRSGSRFFHIIEKRGRFDLKVVKRLRALLSELAPDVLRHRLILSYEALADGVTADDVIERVLEAVSRPVRPLSDEPQRPAVAAAGNASQAGGPA